MPHDHIYWADRVLLISRFKIYGLVKRISKFAIGIRTYKYRIYPTKKRLGLLSEDLDIKQMKMEGNHAKGIGDVSCGKSPIYNASMLWVWETGEKSNLGTSAQLSGTWAFYSSGSECI